LWSAGKLGLQQVLDMRPLPVGHPGLALGLEPLGKGLDLFGRRHYGGGLATGALLLQRGGERGDVGRGRKSLHARRLPVRGEGHDQFGRLDYDGAATHAGTISMPSTL
jgi:hypothetical protein